MLSGDDLSTQYFIVATSIAFLGVAVTQAGWKHPWFLRGMFGSGWVLLVVGLLWAPIISQFPTIKEMANPVGSNHQSWLSLLVLTFLVGFYLTSRSQREWLRNYPVVLEKLGRLEAGTQKKLVERSEVDGSWYSSRSILMLAEVSIRERWSASRQKLDALEADAEQLEQARSILSAKLGPLAVLQSDPDPEFSDLSVKATVASQRMYAESRNLDAINRQLLDDIYGRLWSGDLIAKGFTPPVEPNHDEVPIPAAQWRLLRFDKDMNKAEGGGIAYIGIAVGRPTSP